MKGILIILQVKLSNEVYITAQWVIKWSVYYNRVKLFNEVDITAQE